MRRIIIATLTGSALRDVQARFKQGRDLSSQEEVYPVIAHTVKRQLDEIALEAQDTPQVETKPSPDLLISSAGVEYGSLKDRRESRDGETLPSQESVSPMHPEP